MSSSVRLFINSIAFSLKAGKIVLTNDFETPKRKIHKITYSQRAKVFVKHLMGQIIATQLKRFKVIEDKRKRCGFCIGIHKSRSYRIKSTKSTEQIDKVIK